MQSNLSKMVTFRTGPKLDWSRRLPTLTIWSDVCLTESQIKGVTKGRQGPTLGVHLREVFDKRDLSMIVRMNVVLNRTVVVDSD